MALAAWAVTRAVLLAIGAWSAASHGEAVHPVRMWVQWDAGYYVRIAAEGYDPSPITTGWENGQWTYNFFPVTPAGAWLVGRFVHQPLVAGLMFTNGCTLIALVGLHRLARRHSGERAADWTVMAAMSLPGSFVLSGYASEAPFLAISVWSVLLRARGRPGAAAALGALLSATRITGVLLAVGYGLDWLVARLRGPDMTYARLLPIVAMPLPLIAFSMVEWRATGDGLAFLHGGIAFWQHQSAGLFSNFFLWLRPAPPRLILQSAIGLVLLLVTLWQARRWSPGEIAFTLLTIASFASTGSAATSLLRYMIALYGVHLAAGELAARSVVARAGLAGLAMVNGAIMADWARGLDTLV